MSSIEKRTVALDPSAGPASVEVFFGDALPGRFNVYLQDPSKQQTKVGSAGSPDGGESASVQIPNDPSTLQNWWICVDITVVSPGGDDAQQYFVVTTIRQNGIGLVSVQQSDVMTGNSQPLLVFVRCQ